MIAWLTGPRQSQGRPKLARAAEWLSRLDDNVKLFMNVHPNELADGDAFLERLQALPAPAPKAD